MSLSMKTKFKFNLVDNQNSQFLVISKIVLIVVILHLFLVNNELKIILHS